MVQLIELVHLIFLWILLTSQYYVCDAKSFFPELRPPLGIYRGGGVDSSTFENEALSLSQIECAQESPNPDAMGRLAQDTNNAYGNNNELLDEKWREQLPEQFRTRRGNLYHLKIPTGFQQNNDKQFFCRVYLLGTAHVSKNSCEDAKQLMDFVKPDCLFVELCNQRISLLEEPIFEATNNTKEEGMSVSLMSQKLMENNPGMSRSAAWSSALLSKIQDDYSNKLGVNIGGEFRESFKAACEQQDKFQLILQKRRLEISYHINANPVYEEHQLKNGCYVILGDRPVRLTLVRAWESLSFFSKIKLILCLAWSSIKQPSAKELQEWIESIMNDPNNDVLSKSIEELSQHFPTISETIIKERDRYMAAKLVQTSRLLGALTSEDGKERTIVAIVGAGHCPGMIELLNEYCRRGSLKGSSPEEVITQVVETRNSKVEKCNDTKSLVDDIVFMSTS